MPNLNQLKPSWFKSLNPLNWYGRLKETKIAVGAAYVGYKASLVAPTAILSFHLILVM